MAALPPTCNHIYLSQTIHGNVPPLYFSIIHPPTVSTVERLQSAYIYLKAHDHPRSPFEARDIQALRQELEAGMSRDRREQLQYYVLQIQDTRKRKATEVYLARYPGFVMYGDGKLDFGLAETDVGIVESDGIMERLKQKLKGWW